MINNKQQTAVEWLIDQMFKQGYFDGNKPLSFTNLDHLQQQAKEMEKEQMIGNIKDYNIVVTEFLLNPLLNLEHSQHAIACEKLSDIRNKFISNHILNYNETNRGNK